MDSDDIARGALQRLLRATPGLPAGTPERRREVARKVGCSPDNLYQIASGIKLRSGLPRSVGRDLRAKIEAAYPGWIADYMHGHAPAEGGGSPAEPTLRAALETIRERLASAEGQASEAVGDALKLLAMVPDSDRAFDQALQLLTDLKPSS